jgi:lipid A biosynthesis acyltransferase
MPVQGLEHLERARANGRGVILATVHMGRMLNLAHAVAARGYRAYWRAGPTLDDSPLKGHHGRWWKTQMGWLEERGLRWVGRGQAYELLRALLERGELCWLNWDIPGQTTTSVPVELLGRTIHVARGTGALALETGALVIPAFSWREGHRLVGLLLPGIDPREVTGEGELYHRLARAVDSVLALRPAQVHRGLGERLGGGRDRSRGPTADTDREAASTPLHRRAPGRAREATEGSSRPQAGFRIFRERSGRSKASKGRGAVPSSDGAYMPNIASTGDGQE